MTAAALALAWFLADPPPGDARRLPPVEVLKAGCEFNRRYRDHLEWMRRLWPEHAGRWAALDAEAGWHLAVWDDAWGAHPDYPCSPEQKRAYLRRLRLAIGRDAYYRGGLPPCVPTWRFNELR